MTGQRVSDFVLKWVTTLWHLLASTPIKATSDTVSVNTLLLPQQCIIVGYDNRELVDVLKYKLCYILQHYLRQLEPCYNPANHLKQTH